MTIILRGVVTTQKGNLVHSPVSLRPRPFVPPPPRDIRVSTVERHNHRTSLGRSKDGIDRRGPQPVTAVSLGDQVGHATSQVGRLQLGSPVHVPCPYSASVNCCSLVYSPGPTSTRVLFLSHRPLPSPGHPQQFRSRHRCL